SAELLPQPFCDVLELNHRIARRSSPATDVLPWPVKLQPVHVAETKTPANRVTGAEPARPGRMQSLHQSIQPLSNPRELGCFSLPFLCRVFLPLLPGGPKLVEHRTLVCLGG